MKIGLKTVLRFIVALVFLTFSWIQEVNTKPSLDSLVRMKILSSSPKLTTGDSLFVKLTFEDGWHAYVPDENLKSEPQFEWNASPQITILDPLWPKGTTLSTLIGDVNVYENEVIIEFKVKISIDAPPYPIKLNASIPLCKGNDCVNINKQALLEFPISREHIYSPHTAAPEEGGVLYTLFFAFLGGILLNLMPCVLPVLSLKILSLIHKCHDAHVGPRILRNHGLFYVAGVVSSFLGFAFLFWSIRSQLSWGFQMQSPLFVAGLLILFLTLALNLFGVFEMGLVLTRLDGILPKHVKGYLLTFSKGTLITLVSTPCTGPFMGAALGHAMVQTSLIPFLSVFISLGLGVAFPFTLLCFFPNLQRFMPKPGAWMVLLKEFFGFCLLATVLWLLFVYSQQTQNNDIFEIVALSFLLTLFFWSYGHYQRTPSKTRLALTLLFAALVLTEVSLCHIKGYQTEKENVQWIPYEESLVKKLEQMKKPYFIDCTASWCLTCKINKKLVLTQPDVIKFLKQSGVTLIVADFTTQTHSVSSLLSSFSRTGVPTYIAYTGEEEPKVLPELLSFDLLKSTYAPLLKGTF